MNLALFTKTKSVFFRYVIHVSISIALLISFGTLSYIINKHNHLAIKNSFQAMFRNDRDIGNTAHLTRRLADFETLGVIKCVSVELPSIGVIYGTEFKNFCNSGIWQKITDPIINEEITSISGDSYKISFRVESNKLYRFYIGLFFILSILSFNILIKLHWLKMDLKAKELLQEYEVNRTLDEKIKQQSAEILKAQLDAVLQQSRIEIGRRMAHDIRSPLSVLNIISGKLKKQLPEEGGLLDHASKQIMDIAEGMLEIDQPVTKVSPSVDVSKSQSKIINASLGIQDFVIAIEQTFNLKKVEFEKRSDLRFSFYNEVDSSGQINADKIEVKRIVSNLLNNAVEAISGDGFVALSMFLNDTELILEIRDSGKGMSEDFIKKIQERPLSEGKAKGSGLGLFPSLKLIESWGGRLEIYSKLNLGSTISIILKKVVDQ